MIMADTAWTPEDHLGPQVTTQLNQAGWSRVSPWINLRDLKFIKQNIDQQNTLSPCFEDFQNGQHAFELTYVNDIYEIADFFLSNLSATILPIDIKFFGQIFNLVI